MMLLDLGKQPVAAALVAFGSIAFVTIVYAFLTLLGVIDPIADFGTWIAALVYAGIAATHGRRHAPSAAGVAVAVSVAVWFDSTLWFVYLLVGGAAGCLFAFHAASYAFQIGRASLMARFAWEGVFYVTVAVAGILAMAHQGFGSLDHHQLAGLILGGGILALFLWASLAQRLAAK